MSGDLITSGSFELDFVKNKNHAAKVDEVWNQLTAEYESVYKSLTSPSMERSELSFHEQVKLLECCTLIPTKLPVIFWK